MTTILGLVLLNSATGMAVNSVATLKNVAEFDVPGPGGKRFDYLAIDADGHHLIFPLLAAGQQFNLQTWLIL